MAFMAMAHWALLSGWRKNFTNSYAPRLVASSLLKTMGPRFQLGYQETVMVLGSGATAYSKPSGMM